MDEELYKTGDLDIYINKIEEFKKSERFSQMAQNQKDKISEIFRKIIEALQNERKVEGKFKIPDKIYLEQIKSAMDRISNCYPNSENFEHYIKETEFETDRIMKVEGKIDEKIGEQLYSLYENDDISLGIHGTMLEEGFDITPENNKFFKKGLVCRYGDLRRTVAFQDRGHIHAHGDISFIDLLSYNYSKEKNPTVKKMVEKKDPNIPNRTYFEYEDIPVSQHSCIIAIPKNMPTMSNELFNDGETTIKREINNGTREISGRALKSKYIVAMLKEGDFDSIEFNPKFDLNELIKENSKLQEREEQKTGQDLGKETIEEQKNTSEKNRMMGLLDRMREKFRGNKEK